MRHEETKIADYYATKPSRFSVLKSLMLTQQTDRTAGEMQQQVSLVLANDDDFSGKMLYLDLQVRNLLVKQPSWSLITLSNIEIANATATDAGDTRFDLRDAEQETIFACSCRDFCFAVG